MKTESHIPQVDERRRFWLVSLLPVAACLLLLLGAGCQKPEGAILEIKTTPPGASVEVDGQRYGGETPMRLTLPDGNHLVVASKEGFFEGRTSVNVRPTGVTPLALSLRPLTGLCLIECLPNDSDVIVDGSFRGKTPLLLTDLTYGAHKLSVRHDGYETKDVSHTVVDRQPKLVSVELRSLLVAIKVTSEPSKAKVFLDGSYIGDSPQSLQNVLAGKHKVRLELEGYDSYEQEVTVAGKEEYTVRATLQEKYARIRLDSEPTGSEAYLKKGESVDYESRGKTPVVLDKLHDGEYTVKLTKRGFPDIERKVTLKKGEDLELKIPFEKLVGILQVVTIPPGVEVFVDGESRGVTAPAPNAPQYSAPLFVRDIPQGQRVIKFLKPGFSEANMLVAIKVDQTTTLSNVTLKRLFIADTEIITKDGRTLRGLINRTEADGTIHFETAPGIFMDIAPSNVSSKKSLAK